MSLRERGMDDCRLREGPRGARLCRPRYVETEVAGSNPGGGGGGSGSSSRGARKEEKKPKKPFSRVRFFSAVTRGEGVTHARLRR
jgi:hypothetical protein